MIEGMVISGGYRCSRADAVCCYFELIIIPGTDDVKLRDNERRGRRPVIGCVMQEFEMIKDKCVERGK